MLTGSCSGCGHSFTLLEGIVEPGRGAASPSEAVTSAEEASNLPEPSEGPPCSLCGAPLTVTAAPGGLAATCSGCSSTFQFILQTESERPFRRPPSRGGFREEGRGGFEAPRARPCRACGGPLQFTTSPEGLVTGTCASCGNRFTLPPRRDDQGGGRGGRFGGRGGYAPRPRGGAGWGRSSGDRGATPRFRPRSQPFRRRESRRDDDEEQSSTRPRRRRDEE